MDIVGKKICIHTLGCKVNRAESDTVLGLLQSRGAVITEKIEPADIYIFNTCAVTNEAERKARNLLTKALKCNPDASVYFMGCSVQNNCKKFVHPNVKALFGTGHKTKVVEAILKDIEGNFVTPPDYEFEEIPMPKTKRTRAYVKIQEGCNNFCTYCIIPYLRGRSRSRDFECVKREIVALSKTTNEIVVAGVNTANYGQDLTPKRSLIDICDIFKALENKTRFRFSSLEFIKVIDKRFLSALKDNPYFCDQFHLSLQSGSDVVLKSMNRHYTADEFIKHAKLIREYFPLAGITTDVIVGFPTETDEEFEKSLETCKKCGFTDMHIFPFSMRDGTVASKLYSPLNGDVIKAREKRLFALKEEMRINFLQSLVGQKLEVLVEKFEDNMCNGYAKNFVRCYFESSVPLHNKLVQVEVVRRFEDGVLCRRI